MEIKKNNDAEKYNPPTQNRKWVFDSMQTQNQWMGLVCDQLKITQDDLSRIVEHGGFYLDQKRLESVPQKISAGSELQIYYFLREPEPLEISSDDVLLETDEVLAINKPAWLPVQGTRVSRVYSLEYQLKCKFKNPQLMAIHRLDRQTSGIVLFGKTTEATGKYMKLFQVRSVYKKYLAIVSPTPQSQEWETKGYLIRNFKKLPLDCFRLIDKEKPKSKWSHSQMKLLEAQEDVALVEASPITGRTHQLRVHLASIGSPIIGDTVYGSFKEAKKFGNCRIQLHASRLSFPLTIKGKTEECCLQAPWPEDFILFRETGELL